MNGWLDRPSPLRLNLATRTIEPRWLHRLVGHAAISSAATAHICEVSYVDETFARTILSTVDALAAMVTEGEHATLRSKILAEVVGGRAS